MATFLAELRGYTLLLQSSHASVPDATFSARAEEYCDKLLAKLLSQRSQITISAQVEAIGELNTSDNIWPPACKGKLAAALMETSDSAAGIQTSAMKTQSMQHPEYFLVAKHWHLLRDSCNTIPAKMQLLIGHMMQMGIRNPSEKLVQSLTAIILACHYDSPNIRTTASQRYCMNLDMKSHIKGMAKQWPPMTNKITNYTTPAFLQQNHNEVYQAAFGDDMPISCPIADLSLIVRSVPMRRIFFKDLQINR